MAKYEVQVKGIDKGFSAVLTVQAKDAEDAIHAVRFGYFAMYSKKIKIAAVELLEGEVEFDEGEDKDEMIEF